MKVQFVRSRGAEPVTLDDLPPGWPVPRVGEAVAFRDDRHVWLVVDVLYGYAAHATWPAIVIKLHPEG